ncbi:MAG: hypothetical protein KC478_07880 [Bacteriovoracaceae bacterium]|nr:hypothetical protein [Bacteriovoracaceae bacterium]
MKTAIIVAKNLELNSVELLRAAAQNAGFKTEISKTIKKADLIINRMFGMNYDDGDLDTLESMQANTLNPVPAQRICRDKWLQHMFMLDQKIESCPTFKLPQMPYERGPWMLKTQRGMQGRGVSRHESIEQLKSVVTGLQDSNYIVQKALDFDVELRCSYIGNETIWFEKDGGNLYQGATARRIQNPGQKCVELADKIKNSLGLRFGAVDFLSYEAQVYPIDINCYPGVELIKDEIELLIKMFRDLREML